MALLDAHKHGIDVRVVVDKSNATGRYTAATFLTNQGVPVRVDYRYAIMHDKFVVVDGKKSGGKEPWIHGTPQEIVPDNDKSISSGAQTGRN